MLLLRVMLNRISVMFDIDDRIQKWWGGAINVGVQLDGLLKGK